MEPMRADLDGIRALGELAYHQAGHLGKVTQYMHDHCSAGGAFGGVLNLFQGSYAQALSNADTGLGDGTRGAERSHQAFLDTAAAYEAADRSAYDELSGLAKGQGWNVDAFRAPGSGDAKLVTGGAVPTEAKSEAGPPGEKNLLQTVDGTVGAGFEAYDTYAKSTLEAAADGRKITMVRDPVTGAEHPVYTDHLTTGDRMSGTRPPRVVEDVTAPKSGWDSGVEGINKKLDYLSPGAMAREKVVSWADEKIGVYGEHGAGDAVNQHRAKTTLDAVGNVKTLYDTAHSVAEDPTLGLKGSWDDMQESIDARNRYLDISRGGVSDEVASARNWNRGP